MMPAPGRPALRTAVTVLAALGALAVRRDRLDRVHFLPPVTSVGAPLVCLGLSVQYGWGLSTGVTLVVGTLLFRLGNRPSGDTTQRRAQRR